MGIDLLKLRDHVGEEILAEPGVGPVEKGRSHRGCVFLLLFDGDVFPVYDVTDGGSVDGPVLSVYVPAADPLLDPVVPCGCDIDDSVRRPCDGQDLLRYGHIRSPPFLSSIISYNSLYINESASIFACKEHCFSRNSALHLTKKGDRKARSPENADGKPAFL